MENRQFTYQIREVAQLRRRIEWLERTLTNVVRNQIWFSIALLLGLLIGFLL